MINLVTFNVIKFSSQIYITGFPDSAQRIFLEYSFQKKKKKKTHCFL